MKKILFIFVLAALLCFSACSAPLSGATDNTEAKPNNSIADTTPESTATEPVETENFDPGYFPVPEEPADFSCLSGAGGWRTVLSINRDGTLTGYYEDSEMGSTGEGYPNGTIYVCDFTAVVTDMEKINEYSAKMRLFDITPHKDIGTEWIKDDIRYVVGNPVGIYDPETNQLCEDYILYLPNTPIDEVPAEFLTNWPYQGEEKTTLSCYGILNVATNDGFFYIYEAA